MENFLNFCKTNYLYIEAGLAVLFVLFLVLFIIFVVKKHSLASVCDQLNEESHNHEKEIMDLKSEKTKHETEIKEKTATIQTLIEEKESLLTTSEEKGKMIEELKANISKLEEVDKESSEKISTLETELTTTKTALKEKESECENKALDVTVALKRFETSNKLVDELEKRLKVFEERSAAAEAKATSVNEMMSTLTKEHIALQKEYDMIVKENENLKDIELENRILLKTIKRLQKEDTDTVKETSVILNEEEKPLSYLEVNNMSRSELFETAKKYGFSNFALWSNEKLRSEIKSKL